MRVLGLVAVSAALSLAACSDARPRPLSVTDATSWLERGPVTIEVAASVRRGGASPERHVRLVGTLDVSSGRSHLRIADGDLTPRERYEDGHRVVVASFIPETPRRWTAFDNGVLQALDRRGELQQFNEGTGIPHEYLLAVAREPSPLTALRVLAGAESSTPDGTEAVGAEDMTVYKVKVSAAAVERAFGMPAAADLVVDCAAGTTWRGWVDSDGRLRRLTYRIDHAAFLTDGIITFDPDTAARPIELPPRAETYDLTDEASAVSPREHSEGERRSSPCPPGAREPTAVHRDGCPGADHTRASAREPTDDGWAAVDLRGRRAPNARGTVWLAFREPVLIDDAFDAPDGLDISGVVVAQPERQGTVRKIQLGGIVGLTADDVRRELVDWRDEEGPTSPDPRAPAEPAAVAIQANGSWAALADAGSDCRYWAASPYPSSGPSLAPSVDAMGDGVGSR